MSEVGRVRKVVCAWISLFTQSERWRCQYWSAYVAAAVTWLRLEDLKFVRLALSFVVQNDGDFMDVITLYNWHFSVSAPVNSFDICSVETVVLQFCGTAVILILSRHVIPYREESLHDERLSWQNCGRFGDLRMRMFSSVGASEYCRPIYPVLGMCKYNLF
jgi:hypothetical protein